MDSIHPTRNTREFFLSGLSNSYYLRLVRGPGPEQGMHVLSLPKGTSQLLTVLSSVHL